MRSYHQTNLLTPTQAQEYEEKAQAQEDLILSIFREKPWVRVTAEALLPQLAPGTPLTSVRRALTNLGNQGLVAKAGQVTGGYGRPINQYLLTAKGASKDYVARERP